MSFEDRLIQTLDSLDESEAERLMDGIELHRGVRTRAVIKRISRTESTHIRPIRSTVMLAAAISLFLIASVTGAAAYFISAHKESVDKQFGDGAGERLESFALLDGSVFESEHYRLTVDTVLCTGEQLSAVITLDPKDEETLARVKKLPMLGVSGRNYESMRSELANQGFAMGGGGYSSSFDNDDDPTRLLFFFNADCTCADGREYTAKLKISELCLLAVDGAEGYSKRDDDELEKYTVGEVTLRIKKSIGYRRFESADGTELDLCDIGFRCGAYHELHAFTEDPSITLEYRDGTNREMLGTDIANFSFSGMGRFGGSYTKAGFSRLTDTSDVTAVVIEGIRYEEVRE